MSFKVTIFVSIAKPTPDYISLHNNVGLNSKRSKNIATEIMKNRPF